MQHDFGVARGVERVASGLQLRPQLPEVVDLAVVRELDPSVVGTDRLVSAGWIDDGEPTVAQAGERVFEEALTVGTAVRDPAGHGGEQGRHRARPRTRRCHTWSDHNIGWQALDSGHDFTRSVRDLDSPRRRAAAPAPRVVRRDRTPGIHRPLVVGSRRATTGSPPSRWRPRGPRSCAWARRSRLRSRAALRCSRNPQPRCAKPRLAGSRWESAHRRRRSWGAGTGWRSSSPSSAPATCSASFAGHSRARRSPNSTRRSQSVAFVSA